MIVPPCKDCQDRTVVPNCHMSCKAYQRFAVEREKIRLERARNRVIEDARIANSIKNSQKVNRR